MEWRPAKRQGARSVWSGRATALHHNQGLNLWTPSGACALCGRCRGLDREIEASECPEAMLLLGGDDEIAREVARALSSGCIDRRPPFRG